MRDKKMIRSNISIIREQSSKSGIIIQYKCIYQLFK